MSENVKEEEKSAEEGAETAEKAEAAAAEEAEAETAGKEEEKAAVKEEAEAGRKAEETASEEAAEKVEEKVEAKEASQPKTRHQVPKKGLMQRRESFAQSSVPNAHKGYNPKTAVVMLGIIVIFFVASFILAAISS